MTLLKLLLVTLLGLVWLTTAGCSDTAAPPSTTPAKLAQTAYVSNQECLGCHAQQAQEWQPSHHAQAMALPSAQTVRGDFSDRTFVHQGVKSRFFRRGDAYMVRTDGPDGKLADFAIAYTLGVEPLQQYLIALPGGRLQALAIAWDSTRKAWFHLRPNEKTPPGDVLHWSGRYQTANTLCIVCHTTAYVRGYDAASDSFASTWKEPNVSCQSCHGAGERHVQWAKATDANKSRLAPDGRKGLTVNTHSSGQHAAPQVCAPCHSRRSELSQQGVPGQPLLDHYQPALLQEGLYYADGQQLDEVYVDGSFAQSKMHDAGVTCTHCHNPHTGKLRQEGNALCLQCHAPKANTAFPKAAGNYDSPAHHFHEDGTPGAQCVNCHMPRKVYMGIQARPDHSLRVPRPDLSAKTGAPNACTGCHTNKSAQWAADAVTQRYGPSRRSPSHYGEVFAAYRNGRSGAAGSLVALIQEPTTSAIVRATALAELRNDGNTGMAIRIHALNDASDLVRAAAADGLAVLDPVRRLEVLGPRLSDPVRAVRFAALRSLTPLWRAPMEAGVRAAFDSVLADYVAVQTLALDMPGARQSLGVLYQTMERTELAEQHYLAALRLDPDFSAARLNLAQLYAGLARLDDAKKVLRDGLARVPNIGELHYALALLLAQQGQVGQSLVSLKKAAQLTPQRARIHYNLGLAYMQLGQNPMAEKALLTASKLDASDRDVLYALAAFYYQRRQFAASRQWLDTLLQTGTADARTRKLHNALANAAASPSRP